MAWRTSYNLRPSPVNVSGSIIFYLSLAASFLGFRETSISIIPHVVVSPKVTDFGSSGEYLASNIASSRCALTVTQKADGSDDQISPAHSRAPSDASYLSITPSSVTAYSSASSMILESSEDVLTPDPGTEPDFQVVGNVFAYSPGHLNKMLNPKSLSAYVALGGLAGLERGLRTDIDAGLSIDEGPLEGVVSFEEATGYRNKSKNFNGETLLPRPVATRNHTETQTTSASDPFTDRIRVYSRNIIPSKKATPLWRLMWLAYQDKILLLLTGAAVISLALGVSQLL
jgi:Ca2+-transporting ATPase